MADPVMTREFKDQAQRFAVCKSQYDRRNKNKKTKAEKIEWEPLDDKGFLIT